MVREEREETRVGNNESHNKRVHASAVVAFATTAPRDPQRYTAMGDTQMDTMVMEKNKNKS